MPLNFFLKQQQPHNLLEFVVICQKPGLIHHTILIQNCEKILYLLYYITKCLATHSLNLDDGNIFLKITCVAVFSKVCIRPFSNAF